MTVAAQVRSVKIAFLQHPAGTVGLAVSAGKLLCTTSPCEGAEGAREALDRRLKALYDGRLEVNELDDLELPEPLEVVFQRDLLEWSEEPDRLWENLELEDVTPFRQRVWRALLDIPLGETRTYAELADDLDTSPIAVGQAVGDNRFAPLVPCHRVVASDGLGGYRAGVDVKQRLLKREQEKLEED